MGAILSDARANLNMAALPAVVRVLLPKTGIGTARFT